MSNEALDEKYVQYIAQNRNINKTEANILIDHCIKHISATYNVSYNMIYNAVFSEEGLQHIIKALDILVVQALPCNQLTMEECLKSNTCFYLEPYGCLSKKFPDAELINQNPDKYIKERLGKTEDLKRYVDIASYLYSNYDGGGLTDNSFDSLLWYLAKKEKIKVRALEKIGAPVIEKLRINLEYPMPYLEKAKPGTQKLINYLTNFDTNIKCNWSMKLDGVSGVLIYKKGRLTMMNTKGKDNVGGNVTYLKDYIKIPHQVDYDDFVVRGEFMISKENWENKYNGTFSNARAFVGGKINSGFVVSALNDIEFIAYEIMVLNNEPNVPSVTHAYKILRDQNFNVVENDNFPNPPTTFEIMELYKLKRQSSRYFIDGLVLKVDTLHSAVPKVKSNTIYDASYAIAFKMMLDEQKRPTKVIDIEWHISRFGRYNPVVIYDAVYVMGTRLTRATGHNAKHIESWNMGPGTEIIVVKSGDIIPQIKDVTVDQSIVPLFPSDKYEWHWEKSDIILNDIVHNDEVKIKIILHFFETIELKKFGPAKVKSLYEAGYTTPESIIQAKVSDFIKIKGIGKKTAEQYFTDIRYIMTTTPPDRYVEATTSFKCKIGRVLLKQLFKEFPRILDYNETEIKEKFKQKKVQGFGIKRIEDVATNIPLLRQYLDSFAKEDIKKSIDNYINKIDLIKKNGYNPKIDGKTFVLTQMPFTTDYELEDYIYDNNGNFASTVTSKTEAVICGNVESISTKMETALKLGVTVLYLQEFSIRYEVPLNKFLNKEDNEDNEKL